MTREIPPTIPYEIQETLARGGMGEVHRAYHVETGKEVILKTPQDHEYARQAQIHEAQVLVDLEHPNIVGLIDHGPGWLALTVAPGSPMSVRHPGHLDAQGWRARVRPFFELCHALAYLHGRGWVHADLSPRNLMVTAQGHLTLLDFGLATRFGHRLGVEDLRRAGMMAGTLAYMSPEQLRGEPLDARSDLYALGCLLWEQLTGTPPYRGSRDQMIQGHLTGHLPRFKTSIPVELERMLRRLLSRDPSRRPGHVFALLEVLVTLGFESSMEAPTAKAYLTQPSLVGREGVLGEWRQALEGEPLTSWVLVGEPGVGKSRVAFEMIRLARAEGLEVLMTCGGREVHEALGAFAPWVPDEDLPLDELRLCERVRTHLMERPLTLLVCDDIHLMSPRSQAILSHLLAQGSPRLLACASSEHEVSGFERIERLAPLDAPDTRALTRQALGGLRAPVALTEFLVERAQGNPWMVLEHLRSLLEEGLLTLKSDGSCQLHIPTGTLRTMLSELPSPNALTELLQGRIQRLPQRLRSACVLFASAARALSAQTLRDALDLGPQELLATGLFQETEVGFDLTNQALRQAALAGSSLEERRRWHAFMLEHEREDAQRARHLESLGEFEAAALMYVRVGERALEDNDLHLALKHLRAAYALTTDSGARFELGHRMIEDILITHSRITEVLELLESMRDSSLPRHKAFWHMLNAMALRLTDSYEEALEEAAKMRAYIDPEDLEMCAQWRKLRGDIYFHMNLQFDSARAEHDIGIKYALELGDDVLLSSMLHIRARINMRTNRLDAALADIDRACALAESANRAYAVARYHGVRSAILCHLGRFSEGLESNRINLAYVRRMGSYLSESIAQFHQVVCLRAMGFFGRATRLIVEIAARQAPYGHPYLAGMALLNRSDICLNLGEVGASRRHLEQSKELVSEEMMVPNMVWVLCIESGLHALEGDPLVNREALEQARERELIETEIYDAQIDLTNTLAYTLHLSGAQESVLQETERGLAFLEEVDLPAYSGVLCWLRACVQFSMGTLDACGVEELRTVLGTSRLTDTRIELLSARFWLEEGSLELARDAMSRAQAVAEEEGMTLELMTLWGLEAQLTVLEGEDPSFALEEFWELRNSTPEGLPWRAWWQGELPEFLRTRESA